MYPLFDSGEESITYNQSTEVVMGVDFFDYFSF